ncbi:ABC transporter permease, partial [Mesorhizobium sp. M4B.F.Ca.ET.013.02.1.1]
MSGAGHKPDPGNATGGQWPAGTEAAFSMRGTLLRKNLMTALLLAPATLWLVVFLV